MTKGEEKVEAESSKRKISKAKSSVVMGDMTLRAFPMRIVLLSISTSS